LARAFSREVVKKNRFTEEQMVAILREADKAPIAVFTLVALSGFSSMARTFSERPVRNGLDGQRLTVRGVAWRGANR
jgi:hypothetical protein